MAEAFGYPSDHIANLDAMYYTGQGVTQDYVQAHTSFNIAAARRRVGAAKIMTTRSHIIVDR